MKLLFSSLFFFILFPKTIISGEIACLIAIHYPNRTEYKVNEKLSFQQKLKCKKVWCPTAEKYLNCIDENAPIEKQPQDASELYCCTTLSEVER